MNIARRNELKTLADAYRTAQNAAAENLSRSTVKAAAEKLAALTEKVEAYNKDVTDEAYKAVASAENPFLTAIQQNTFPGLAKVVTKWDKLPDGKKSDKIVTCDVTYDTVGYYDLVELDKLSPDGKSFGHELCWQSTVGGLRLTFAAARAEATALDVAKFRRAFGLAPDMVSVSVDYNASTDDDGNKLPAGTEARRLTVELAKRDTISINALRDLLQFAVDTVIFADNGNCLNSYRVTKQDVRFMLASIANYDAKKHTTRYARTETIYGILFDILGRVVCKRDYNVYVKEA